MSTAPIRIDHEGRQLKLWHGDDCQISTLRSDRFTAPSRLFGLKPGRETERWQLPSGATVQISRALPTEPWRFDWLRRAAHQLRNGELSL